MNQIIAIVAVLQSSFVLGVSLACFALYFRHPNKLHIACVAASYIMLTMVTCEGLFVERIALNFRMWFLMAAYGLGDFALVILVYRSRTQHYARALDFDSRLSRVEEALKERNG